MKSYYSIVIVHLTIHIMLYINIYTIYFHLAKVQVKISLKTNILQTKTRKKRIIHEFNKIWKLPNLEFQTTTQNKVLKWTLFWYNTSKIESMKNGIKQLDCMEFFELKNKYFCNLVRDFPGVFLYLHMIRIQRFYI